MKLGREIQKLCTPAYVYLIISIIIIVVMLVENIGHSDKFCFAGYSCNVPNTTLLFIAKLVYVAFWTIVLNALCVAGYRKLSWFLVLLPLIVFGLSLVMMFIDEAGRVVGHAGL